MYFWHLSKLPVEYFSFISSCYFSLRLPVTIWQWTKSSHLYLVFFSRTLSNERLYFQVYL